MRLNLDSRLRGNDKIGRSLVMTDKKYYVKNFRHRFGHNQLRHGRY